MSNTIMLGSQEIDGAFFGDDVEEVYLGPTLVWSDVIDVYLTQEQQEINLEYWLASNYPGVKKIRIINNLTQPTIRTGNLESANIKVELVNNGEIQGFQEGSDGLVVESGGLTLINNGWIRGSGGRGGNGGAGGNGANSTVSTQLSPIVGVPSLTGVGVKNYETNNTDSVVVDYAVEQYFPQYGCTGIWQPLTSYTRVLSQHININVCVAPSVPLYVKRGTYRGLFVYSGKTYYVYDVLRQTRQWTTGGSGAPTNTVNGNGKSFTSSRSDGQASQPGGTSSPAGGNSGGNSGKKGNGGDWGVDGGNGGNGYDGAGNPGSGANGVPGMNAGFAINGSAMLISGSVTGNVSGDIVQ